jgi:hypothetical protein
VFGRRLRIAAGICVHNEEEYIAYCLKGIYDLVDVIAVSVNTGVPWGGKAEPLDRTLELVQSFPDPDGKMRIQTGEWQTEVDQRNSNLDLVRDEVDLYMVLDADEFYCADEFRRMMRYIAWRPWVGQFRVRVRTYWKTNPLHIIDPPEPLKQNIISWVRPSTRFIGLRRTSGRVRHLIPPRVVVLHHFSYARTSEKVLQKTADFSHRDDVAPDWFANVWLRWDQDHSLENLHPTHPPEYKRAIPVDIDSLPEVMRDHPFAQPARSQDSENLAPVP